MGDPGPKARSRLSALVEVAHPELADAPIRFLGDGCDHDNYLVADSHVLRIPKNAEVEKRLVAEVALLGRLEVSVRVPSPLGPLRHPDCPFVYAIYPYLAGTAGDVAERVEEVAVARALGRMLRELHDFDVEEALALGLPEEQDPVDAWLEVVRRVSDDVSDVLAHVPESCLDSSGLPARRESVLVHADLGGEHVLLDPEDGAVAAVIDWADASVTDPALDYAGLLGWLGEDFLRRTLAAGSIPHDEDDIVRARFFAMAVAIHSIALGRQLGKTRWIDAGERMIRRVERRAD